MLDGLGIERGFVGRRAGAAPHRELAVQRGVGSGGVYMSFFSFACRRAARDYSRAGAF